MQPESVDAIAISSPRPADLPVLVALAREASACLDAAIACLDQDEVRWLAEAPLDWAGPLVADASRRRGLLGIESALLSVAGRVANHGPEWEGRYGQLLLLSFLAALPTATPAFAMPPSAWPHMESGLALALDVAKAGPVPSLADEFFQKDLAVAQLNVLPFEGLIGAAERVQPRFLASEASWRERAALALYLRGDFWRSARYFNRHQWRGYRDGYHRPWQIRMVINAEVLVANPAIAGLFGAGWLFDPAISVISPRLAETANGFRSMGARDFRMTTDGLAIERALSLSRTRRALYEAGKYTPANYGLIVHRRDVLRWLRENAGKTWEDEAPAAQR